MDYDRPNESRADWGANIAGCSPDWGKNELETDVKDALADVVHYLHRIGVDPHGMFMDALESAQGDLEDGLEAAFDPSVEEKHGLSEAGPGEPPEHLVDAWRRFQAGDGVSGAELRALDEWRADAREEALGW